MDVLVSTLSSDQMWGAILASIVIISLGFILTKAKILKNDWRKGLNAIVLNIAVPALVFKSFMTPVTLESIKREGFVIGFSIVFYLILLIISKYVFIWVKETTNKKHLTSDQRKLYADRLLMQMMWVFGSTGFFGLPIIDAVFGASSMITASNYGFGYRIFLFSYVFAIMGGVKINRSNLKVATLKILKNPMVIVTFLGLFFWMIQLAFPEVVYKGEVTTFFDLGKTAPWLFKSFALLAALASPLIWISIGISLANSNIKIAFKNKLAWSYVAFKQLILPGVTLFILIGFAQIKSLNLDADAIATITVLMATPPAAIVVSLAMKYKRSEILGMHTTVVSTLASIVAMPFWITIANVVSALLI